MKHHSSPFKWRHFEPEIILLSVRWYCRYSLSASRIIERKPVLVGGEVVGERVEALFRSGAAIVRTKGKTLYLIEAPSLSLAIALEKSKGED